MYTIPNLKVEAASTCKKGFLATSYLAWRNEGRLKGWGKGCEKRIFTGATVVRGSVKEE